MNSLVTTVYALDEDEKTLGIHSKCHMLFAPEEEEPEKVHRPAGQFFHYPQYY